MRIRLQKGLYVVAAVVTLMGSLVANEFRSPLIGERGPMRYVFEEWEEKHDSLKMWSAMYGRYANKCYMSHGFKTHELTALIFNQEQFTLAQTMPGSYADKNTQYYSPFLTVITMKPQITYSEVGFSMGARWAYPIYKNKGRIGLRAQIPFRRIEIERNDEGDKDTNQLKDVYTQDIVTVKDPNNTPAGDVKDVLATAIRLDFMEALYYKADHSSLIDYAPTPANPIQILGSAGNLGGDPINGRYRFGAVIYSPVGHPPAVAAGNTLGVHGSDSTLSNLPAAGNISDFKQYQFATGTDYKTLSVDLAATPAARLAAQQRAANLWFTSAHTDQTYGIPDPRYTPQSNSLFGLMDSKYLAPFINENTYAWLEDQNYGFDTETRMGLGDLDLDLFYEHKFTDDSTGEIFVGVRFPTGTDSDYTGNPYRPHLGNGQHWEVRGGALLAWQPVHWMNVKLDGYYSFVLKSDEDRCATFKGASLKNIGPKVEADVDWTYLVAHLDFNLFHPKTDAISSVIGYELYYKMKDHVSFKKRMMESWLGNVYDPTTATWSDGSDTLDSSICERNTESIAHKLRYETSIRLTKWFELYAGGTYTFAGEHVAFETDAHGGFVITF